MNAAVKMEMDQEVQAESDRLCETRYLLRLAFYAGLGRRAPDQLISTPSYVKAVKRKFNLQSGNQARQMLAEVEGFKSWTQLMVAMLKQANSSK